MKNTRTGTLDRAAYMSGRDDARAGLERYPRQHHPDNYGAYNAGFRDWQKLQAFPALFDAAREFLAELDSSGDFTNWERCKAKLREAVTTAAAQ